MGNAFWAHSALTMLYFMSKKSRQFFLEQLTILI